MLILFEKFSIIRDKVLSTLTSIIDNKSKLNSTVQSNLWWVENRELNRNHFLERFDKIEIDSDNKIIIYRAIQFNSRAKKFGIASR